MIRIGRLPERRWEEYKALRLEALLKEPSAFGSSFEEEARFPEDVWRERIGSVLFALADGRPVGLLSYVFTDRAKTRHIAHIFGVYVKPENRGKGIGRMLVRRALAEIQKKADIVKIRLDVNPLLRAAIGLYQESGFVVTGRAKNELKVGGKYFDLLSMEKEVRNVPEREKGGEKDL